MVGASRRAWLTEAGEGRQQPLWLVLKMFCPYLKNNGNSLKVFKADDSGTGWNIDNMTTFLF